MSLIIAMAFGLGLGKLGLITNKRTAGGGGGGGGGTPTYHIYFF